MPSGPDHWHAHWETDGKALDYLKKRGFRNDRGHLRDPEIAGFEPDNLDYAAIDYLCQEWDYSYEP